MYQYRKKMSRAGGPSRVPPVTPGDGHANNSRCSAVFVGNWAHWQTSEKVKALNKHLVISPDHKPSRQIFLLELRQLCLSLPDGTGHQSDSDAAAEIKALTLAGITQKTMRRSVF
jgi:hypothetical protein